MRFADGSPLVRCVFLAGSRLARRRFAATSRLGSLLADGFWLVHFGHVASVLGSLCVPGSSLRGSKFPCSPVLLFQHYGRFAARSWLVRSSFAAAAVCSCLAGTLGGFVARLFRCLPSQARYCIATGCLAMCRWLDAGWLRVPGLFWVGSFVVRGRLARGLAQTCFWSRVSVTVVASGSSGSLSGPSPLRCSAYHDLLSTRAWFDARS